MILSKNLLHFLEVQGYYKEVDGKYIWVPYEIVTKENADKILGDK